VCFFFLGKRKKKTSSSIGSLQPIPRDPKENGVVAMLVVLRKVANEKPEYDHQHGGNDVTCKPRIARRSIILSRFFSMFLCICYWSRPRTRLIKFPRFSKLTISIDKFQFISLFGVILLLHFEGIGRGGVKGNVLQGIYCIALSLLSTIVSAPRSPVTIKAASTFSDGE